MIQVTVPATTANLGPGFDTLGMALDIEAVFTFERAETLQISGCPECYCNENNLVWKSYCHCFEHYRQTPVPLKIHIDSPIPPSRGLGSSAACIIAGLLAAARIMDQNVSDLDLLTLACEIEGHPDNVTPALLGGLKSAAIEEDCLLTADFNVSDRIRFAALIPDFPLETEKARQCLPEMISHKEAVQALGKLALLLKGLESGDETLLHASMNEPLHEPYRIPLIDEFEDVRQLCLDLQAASVVISGSGPTILAIFIDNVPVDALNMKLASLKHSWKLVPCTLQSRGAKVEVKEEDHE